MCGIWDGFFLFPAVPSSPADAAVESRASMVIDEPCHPRQAIETSPQQCDPTAGIIRSSYSHFQGMNYPYGEHVLFTGCQPVISNTLKAN